MLHYLAVRPALAAVAALAMVPAAHADAVPSDDGLLRSSQAVSFQDLDLGTAHGRATLQHRMRVAAQSVCGYDGSRRSLSEMAASQECYDRAMRDANVQIAAIIGARKVATR